jgi:hypothetical protein
MQMVSEKIRADKKLLIPENLTLTAAEARAFWPVYGSYQQELIALNDRMVKFIKENAKNNQTMSNQTAKGLMDEYRLCLKSRFCDEFLSLLRSNITTLISIMTFEANATNTWRSRRHG